MTGPRLRIMCPPHGENEERGLRPRPSQICRPLSGRYWPEGDDCRGCFHRTTNRLGAPHGQIRKTAGMTGTRGFPGRARHL